jgi:hypothetical protein
MIDINTAKVTYSDKSKTLESFYIKIIPKGTEKI